MLTAARVARRAGHDVVVRRSEGREYSYGRGFRKVCLAGAADAVLGVVLLETLSHVRGSGDRVLRPLRPPLYAVADSSVIENMASRCTRTSYRLVVMDPGTPSSLIDVLHMVLAGGSGGQRRRGVLAEAVRSSEIGSSMMAVGDYAFACATDEPGVAPEPRTHKARTTWGAERIEVFLGRAMEYASGDSSPRGRRFRTELEEAARGLTS